MTTVEESQLSIDVVDSLLFLLWNSWKLYEIFESSSCCFIILHWFLSIQFFSLSSSVFYSPSENCWKAFKVNEQEEGTQEQSVSRSSGMINDLHSSCLSTFTALPDDDMPSLLTVNGDDNSGDGIYMCPKTLRVSQSGMNFYEKKRMNQRTWLFSFQKTTQVKNMERFFRMVRVKLSRNHEGTYRRDFKWL